MFATFTEIKKPHQTPENGCLMRFLLWSGRGESNPHIQLGNLNTGIRETAKELGVKEKDFVRFLLDKKYLYRDKKGKLQPYAQFTDDLFVLKECFNEKTSWSGTQLLITPKGRETFRLLFLQIA